MLKRETVIAATKLRPARIAAILAIPGPDGPLAQTPTGAAVLSHVESRDSRRHARVLTHLRDKYGIEV